MDYNPPVGGSGEDPYVDSNPPTTLGSQVPAAAVEYPQREVVAVIEGAGLTASNGTLNQMLLAIRKLIRDFVNNYTKQQYFATKTLTDGANISWDLDVGQVAKVTLGGNRTLDNPTNMKDGAFYAIRVYQDATGGRTLSYGTAYKWVGSAPVIGTDPNDMTLLMFTSDGTNMFGSDRGPYAL